MKGCQEESGRTCTVPRQNEEALLSGQLGIGKGWGALDWLLVKAGGYKGQERGEVGCSVTF